MNSHLRQFLTEMLPYLPDSRLTRHWTRHLDNAAFLRLLAFFLDRTPTIVGVLLDFPKSRLGHRLDFLRTSKYFQFVLDPAAFFLLA